MRLTRREISSCLARSLKHRIVKADCLKKDGAREISAIFLLVAPGDRLKAFIRILASSKSRNSAFSALLFEVPLPVIRAYRNIRSHTISENLTNSGLSGTEGPCKGAGKKGPWTGKYGPRTSFVR